MKWMKQLRLVNWHYFQDEILEFGKQTLISGRNSAGKSTIIDAMQVLFIADLRQIRFNPAAHEEAKRSIINYLRGKIGSDEKSYVRERDFTTYLLAEFYDDKTRESFVVGTVLDVYSDNKIDDEHFILPDLKFSQFELKNEKGRFRNREEFHSYALRLRPKGQFYRVKLEYQKAFRSRMGQLEPRFYRTFLRALSFKPIQDIREFVYMYILDAKELQLQVMKENFDLHERYQRELEALLERQTVLDQIARQHEQGIRFRDIVVTQEYAIRGLKHLVLTEDLALVEQTLVSEGRRLEDLQGQINLAEEQHREARGRAEEYLQKYSTHELKKEQEQLTKTLQELRQDLEEKQSYLQVFESKVKREIALLENLKASIDLTTDFWGKDDYAELQKGIDALGVALLNCQAAEIQSSSFEAETIEESFRTVGQFLAGLQKRFLQAQTRLEDKISELEILQARLIQDIRGLEQKKRPYKEEILRLKALLEERLAGRSPVWIFCEELEVLDEAWRNAIEGYLHTQKFDLLVEPEVFAEALHLYEQEKWAHRLEGIGLVDTDKEKRYRGNQDRGSLATLLQTGNPVIQARIDHLLGRVIQARDEQELRQYPTAITQTCMSYHNLVARQIPKARYEVPYIGSQAIVRQLEIKRSELEKTEALLRELRRQRQVAHHWVDNLADRRNLYDNFADGLELPVAVRSLETGLEELQTKLNNLDLSEVDRLKAEYEVWRQREYDLVKGMNQLSAQEALLKKSITENQTNLYLISRRVEEAQAHWDSWKTSYGPEFWDKAEERWQEASKQDLAAATKLTNWENSQKGNATRRDQEFRKLHDLRQTYNIRYTYSGDLDSEDNASYQSLLDEVAGVNIPEYQEKLTAAMQQSEEEFKSDFIAKMREAIEMARYEFNQLNLALKTFPFHEDKYHFEVRPSDKYKRFYEVIMDPNIIERGSLFDALADEKADALHELFERLVRGEAGDQEEFTDYRRYLDFDIAVTGKNGRYLFSQVLKEKSGGETQTPFYIAVLASFYHLYNSGKTLRLVVFDEAFNKMDEERIQTSLRLIKQMNLQLIAAVPDEKMQHMAPEVSTTLIVHREGHHCFVDMISRAEILDNLKETEERGETGETEGNLENKESKESKESLGNKEINADRDEGDQSQDDTLKKEQKEPSQQSGGLFADEPSLFDN